jgi:hypothetical protein
VGPYVSDGMTTSIRAIFGGGLQHTYTLVPYSYSAPDFWTDKTATAGTPVTGKKCRYLPKPLIREYDTGRATLVLPAVTDDTLLVPWDDPIKVGDHVKDIRAHSSPGEATGRLLFTKEAFVEVVTEGEGEEEDTVELVRTVVAGEAIVISEADHAGLGPVTLRRLVLKDLEEQELPNV